MSNRRPLIVTMVVVATGFVNMEKPPASEPAVTVTDVGTEATAGLLLVNWKVWSYAEKEAMLTRPVALPGSTVNQILVGPPLTVTDAEIAELGALLRQSVREAFAG